MRWLLKSNGQLNYTNDDRLHCNTSHYNDVLSRVARVENTLWIGTADIKDLHVRVERRASHFLPF